MAQSEPTGRPAGHTFTWSVTVGDATTTAIIDLSDASDTDEVIVLGHGASTHSAHPTMERLAGAMRAAGLHVVRLNFLYTEQKKGPPDRMPRLMECFRAVAERARAELKPVRLYLGGHSMGGRAASHLAAESYACDGLILLSYPLHPAGQPEKLRDAHLPSISVPVLCLNGTRDELCDRTLMTDVLAKLPATWTIHWLEGADHGYRVQKRSGRTEAEVLEEITRAVREWRG